MPESHYHFSGKFDWKSLIIASTLALIACIGGGIFYSTSMKPGGFSGGWAVALLLLVIWLFLVFYLFRRFNHSRNINVNAGVGVVLCGVTWLFGHGGWESLVLLLPLTMLLYLDYYCEKCGKYYSNKTFYVLNAGEYYKHEKKLNKEAPPFSFLPNINFQKLPTYGPTQPQDIIKIRFSYCKSCGSNAIVDIHSCKWTRSASSKNAGRSNVTQQETLADAVYLDDTTGKKLSLLSID
ncbi:hypothetical protein [Chitinophaga sp. LS1]|nr:hypothetical protein [Chitinophaga sp. LS1]WPV67224.1 hypothetical protein QQL36_00610 [Chitinophaga sp. LS1]